LLQRLECPRRAWLPSSYRKLADFHCASSLIDGVTFDEAFGVFQVNGTDSNVSSEALLQGARRVRLPYALAASDGAATRKPIGGAKALEVDGPL
jgi:hypothetical protein